MQMVALSEAYFQVYQLQPGAGPSGGQADGSTVKGLPTAPEDVRQQQQQQASKT